MKQVLFDKFKAVASEEDQDAKGDAACEVQYAKLWRAQLIG
ncbi:MAG TPA: hypothetical protein PKA05_14515 [Roseiflexaceae bacterium]|nr:hypothetical protein [Roseiflexaceae bacterium]